MSRYRTVTVKQLPEIISHNESLQICDELSPLLAVDCPCIVFDFSNVQKMDSSGVDMLLRCMEESMKRNGDIKLAAIAPAVAVILQLTRIDRLFEIFEQPQDAVESFHRFPVEVLRFRNAGPSAQTAIADGD